MKQVAAILLLGIFSFNLFGYRLVATFLENQQNKKLELAFDENNYFDCQLISIKQPTNLPYYNNSADFQRIDGEVNIDGIIYKYVKCRIYNDSLELLCIPNAIKMRIQAVKADFSRSVSDLQQSVPSHKSHPVAKSFQKAFSEFEEERSIYAFKINILHSRYFTRDGMIVNRLFPKLIEQPPDPTMVS